ncbi:PadR family transcriptional regulator [Gordonia sp. HY002]|uniref:PadR family transcriptional regulator n=1 Tax=Gordonia zhenghanii TaxID=2911516 RepID=UPI001EEFC5B8|nr:PadR family transcriptional regulator [Gordonia zhenghanii]MCF8571157.1 PadR family transcriptional regulator [Gordonia zhenghanii]MCF8607185.1 PadR family transcriptional regulator [Gordonia zhenghanii]
MALRHALLAALLTVGEASGYDLAKEFDPARATFWTASPQQIYRELDGMEGAGLVSARVVRQSARPDKRMLSLTDAGRAELTANSRSAAKPTAIRDEMLVMVQSVSAGDPRAVCVTIRDRLTASRRKLAHYERIEDAYRAGRDDAAVYADGQIVGPYLTLLRGLAFERENIAWCETALTALSVDGDSEGESGA